MKRWTPLLSVLMVVALAGLASACPMCKDSIPNSEAPIPGGSLPHGFNTSVYSMLVGFLTVLGMIIGVIVRGIRGG